ncbi:MAG TPA: SURF1 family protein [Micavibrio sp.]|jgi:surfeit locus 1 family protein
MKKFPVWATVFMLLGVVILCSLGTWQIKRLHWKQNLIADLEKAAAAEPTPLDSAAIAHAVEIKTTILRGILTGHYLHDREINVGPRPHDDKMGHHVVVPFELQDGMIVFVLRGWMADGDSGPVQRPGGTLAIPGALKPPASTNPFTPKNNPEKNQWYYIDPAQMGSYMKLDHVAPLVFYEQTVRNGKGWPTPIDVMTYPDNNHLSYAIFWFSMAGILLAIYGLRFIPAGRKKG